VLIGYERAKVSLRSALAGRGDESVYLSAITASELLHGVERARDASTRARRAAWVEGLLSAMPVLAVDLNAARAHAMIWAHLAAQGAMIGAHDSWIAAQALTHDLAIATLNERGFARVPGLVVENWGGNP
jgi:predicted nucleic acid-binding protein